MRTIVTQAIVELRLPDALDLREYEERHGGSQRARVKIGLRLNLKDVVLRLPEDVQSHYGGKVITIKNLVLEGMHGTMLPEFDPSTGNYLYFTITDAEKAPSDASVVAQG